MTNEDGIVPVHLFPNPGSMLLLLRAALPPSRDDSPYLVLRHGHNGAFTSYVTVHKPGEHMDHALMLTGHEALSHAFYAGWESVLDPTAAQLRDLAGYAVQLRDLRTWEEDYGLWNLTTRTASWVAKEESIALTAKVGAIRARDRWAR